MKKYLILGLALAALTTMEHRAEAYSSAVGVDPKNNDVLNGNGNGGYGDYETKTIVKSATAGKSASLQSGIVVALSSEDDGYTVTKMVTQTVPGQRFLTCVTMDEVATGDTAYHRCITRGFARVKFSNGASFAIAEGVQACVNQDGLVRGCDTTNGEATVNTGILPLENKAVSTSGSYLRVMLNLK